jgi:DNA-binding LacI/PurR family transcriptional regulator
MGNDPRPSPIPRAAGRGGVRRGPSMADVAREAGVSGQTVSRVANGLSNVDARTRAKVLDAMRLVGYRPNSAARALRNGRFRSIGVILFDLSTFGGSSTLQAISAAALASGYSITLMPVAHATHTEVSGAFSRLNEHAVDGVIILVEAHQLELSHFRLPDNIPTVIVDSNATYPHRVVDTNQALGAEQATTHLLDLGHETVWHIAGPLTSYAAERRAASWEATLRRHGRVVPPLLAGDWSSDSGYRLGKSLAEEPEVTAVFAGNDQMALGLIRALHEAGRRVPEEISVVGFDNMSDSANFWPPLTTISQSFAEVGRLSVGALVTELRTGEHLTGLVTVPTELVIRCTTAPPQARGRSAAGVTVGVSGTGMAIQQQANSSQYRQQR